MQNFRVQFLDSVRQKNPLVHNITNIVSAHFSANGLLAIGASPFMSDSPNEMRQIPAISDVLVINMGAISDAKIAAMIDCGQEMNRLGKPVVLDPVGAGATPYRQQAAKQLLQNVRFDAVRGNAGEIAFLAGIDWQARGVDAGKGDVAALGRIAQTCAQKLGCAVALSGKTDYLGDGKTLIAIDNGTPLFPKITASGCLLACVVGAFVAVADRSQTLEAATEACVAYAVAGELAAGGLNRENGTFYTRLIDRLAALDALEVENLAKVRVLSA